MQQEETQKTSQEPQEIENEDDFSKEIEIAESIKKQALDHFKREAVDTWNVQHSVIRNYLWLSLTFIASYCAVYSKSFDATLPSTNYCPIILTVAIVLASVALIVGIVAMSGTSSIEPDDNYHEIFDYLTATGYDQGNHYAILSKEIISIKVAIEKAQEQTCKRGKAMRLMNRLLLASIGFAFLSAIF